jgi:hypothetical protein
MTGEGNLLGKKFGSSILKMVVALHRHLECSRFLSGLLNVRKDMLFA